MDKLIDAVLNLCMTLGLFGLLGGIGFFIFFKLVNVPAETLPAVRQGLSDVFIYGALLFGLGFLAKIYWIKMK